MKKLSIRSQIFAMAGVLLVFLTATAGIAILSMSRLAGDFREVNEIEKQVVVLDLIWEEFEKATVAALRFNAGETGMAQVVETNLQQIFDKEPHIDDVFVHTANPAAANAEAGEHLKRIIDGIKDLEASFQKAAVAVNIIRINIFRDEIMPDLDRIERELNELQEGLFQRAEQRELEAMNRIQEAEQTVFLSGCVGVVLALLIALVFGRSLSRPIERIAHVVTRLANRDLDVAITDQERGDEIGEIARNLGELQSVLRTAADAEAREKDVNIRRMALFDDLRNGLKSLAEGQLDLSMKAVDYPDLDQAYLTVCDDFNSLVESLNTMILTVHSSAGAVKSGAGEITQVAHDLSKRTETQAATLEESAAALDQLTSSVRGAAEKAAEADRAVSENRAQAEASGKVVRDAVAAMQDIQDSSSQVTQIISVIDDIAFQTNLLALNAGVEAARAGEAGRGFAVVASEVRALAQRASDSAREIKELISKSTSQVEEGGLLVGKTGDALGEIVARFSQVSELVSDIATSAREQAIGLQEINTGVNELDQVTQQNAAVVEEATAASEQLNNEAARLINALSRFSRTPVAGKAMEDTEAANVEHPVPVPSSKHHRPERRTVNGPSWSEDGWEDF